MPKKRCYRGQKDIFRSAERQSGRCFFVDEHPQKLRRSNQRISVDTVQTVIDNNLITLPGWDGY